MGNQRSFLLLIALVAIGFYLYYKSVIRKIPANASPVEETINMQSIENLKMSHGRRLFTVNKENFQPRSGEETPNQITESNNKDTIDTSRFLERAKRLKREIGDGTSLHWEYRVNATRLNSKSFDFFKVKNSKPVNIPTLNMAIYLSGEGPRHKSEFQHAYNAVENLLGYLFGDDSIVRHNVVKYDGLTVFNEIYTVEGKESDSNSERRGKFLTSFFNFGGNQENPPLEGSGEILNNQEPQTELMQDLSFINEKKDTNVPKSTEIFSDIQELADFNTSDINLDPLNKNIPPLQMSNTREVIAATEDLPVDEHSEVIEFCMNMLSNFKKSNEFLEFPMEGSGDVFSTNNKSTEEFQVIETTTELSKVFSDASLPQKGVLDRIWDSIPKFGFGNERRNNFGTDSLSMINLTKISSDMSDSLVNLTKIGSEISNGLLNSFGSNISSDNLGNITNSLSLINFTRISNGMSDSLENITKIGSKISNELLNGLISNRSNEAGNIFNSVEAIYGNSIEECKNILLKVNIKSDFNMEAIHENSNNETNSIYSSFNEKVFISHNSEEIDLNEDIQRNSLKTNESTAVEATTSKVGHGFNLKTVTAPENAFTDINIEESKLESITEKFNDLTDIVLDKGRQNIEVVNEDFASTLKNSVAFENPNDFQTTKGGRFFDDINGDGILELGSSDERSIFEGLFGSGREELKVSNFNQETTTSLDRNERFIIPNFLNLGSGFSELSEGDSKDGLLNSDYLQNRSFGIFNVASGERSLNDIDTTNSLEFTQSYSKISDFNGLIQQNKLKRFETTTTTRESVVNMINSFNNKDDTQEDTRIKDISRNTTSNFNPNLMKITKLPRNLDIEIEESFQEHNFSTRSESPPLPRRNLGKRQRSLDIDANEYFQEPVPTQSESFLDRKGEIFNKALLPDQPSFNESSDLIIDSKPEEITKEHEEIFTEVPPDELINLFNFQNIINSATDSIPSITNSIDVEALSKGKDPVSEDPIELNKLITTDNVNLHKLVTTVSTAKTKSSISSTTQTNIGKDSLNINPNAKILTTKNCMSARECNSSLNERCISNEKKLICGCSRALVRSPESGKCEASIIMQTSVKLPREQFHNDLKNRNSELYKKKSGEAVETMWSLLRRKPKVFASVAEVHVDKFEEGSLVVKWNIKIVNERNETVQKLAEIIDNDLKDLLENELPANIPLDLHNASASSLIVSPCMVDDLNYCDENAKCIPDDKTVFRCECKDGYLDVSQDYSGEVCKVICEEDFCGDHGQCQLKAHGEKHCLCAGWYFGRKCEWSGTIVIAAFGAANFLILFIVILIVCICRKRRRHCSRNLSNFQPSGSLRAGRITDSIALDDVGPGKVSKFLNMSTPMLNTLPVIQVTSPSFPGSSIDYDSTFDRSICFSEDSKKENVFTKNV